MFQQCLSVSHSYVVSEFLKAELKSTRFGNKIVEAITKLGVDISIVQNSDISNPNENKIRENILYSYRLKDDFFDGFPDDTEWFETIILASKLIINVEYIDYSYWNELSLNTRKPLVAAKNINENKLEGLKLVDKFIEFSRQIKKQKQVDPIILVSDYKKDVILEGHSRITAMSLLNPEDLDFEVKVIIGYSKKMSDWACF